MQAASHPRMQAVWCAPEWLPKWPFLARFRRRSFRRRRFPLGEKFQHSPIAHFPVRVQQKAGRQRQQNEGHKEPVHCGVVGLLSAERVLGNARSGNAEIFLQEGSGAGENSGGESELGMATSATTLARTIRPASVG